MPSRDRWAGRVRLLVVCAACSALVFVALVGVSSAGSTTTIDFGTAAAPTALYDTTQPFDAAGIDFDQSYASAVADPGSLGGAGVGLGCSPEVVSDPANARADSGGQVLRDGCYDTEHFSSWSNWSARLHNSADQVSAYLLPYGDPSATVILTGYDFAGDPVATTKATIPAKGDTLMTITSGSADIYFISMQIPDRQNVNDAGFEIDDLSYDDPGTGTPEVLLTGPVYAPGYSPGSATTAVGVDRFNGASSPVDLSLSSPLPSYVTLTGGSTVVSGSADSGSLIFTIKSGAPAPKLVPITVAGTSAGVTIAPLAGDVSIGDDFQIYMSPDTPSVGLVAGAGTQDAIVELYLAGTGGPIKFTASGLPSGVTAKFSPNPASGGFGTYVPVTVALKAVPTAAPVSDVPITVTAKLTTSSSVPAETTKFSLYVSTFDLRAQGLEVTQGTQTTGPLGGQLFPSGTSESGTSYSGIALVANKKTVVRFFGDAYGAPLGVPGVIASLTGFRGGAKLGTIFADYGPGPGPVNANLPDTQELDPAPVYYNERVVDANAFTFTLPRSWTLTNGDVSSTIKLVGQLSLPPQVPNLTGGSPISYTQECGKPVCPNNSFVLTGVTFNPTGPPLTVSPISLSANGVSPGTEPAAFAYARAVVPLPDDGVSGLVVYPYQGYFNISSIENTYGPTPTTSEQNVINFLGLTYVENWVSSNGNPTNAIGVSASVNTRGLTQVPGVSCSVSGSGPSATLSCSGSPPSCGPESCFFGSYDNPTTGGPSIVDYLPTSVFQNRPLTSVAHELGHQLGLLHASPCGGAGTVGSGSESWPPDEQGELQGVGLNVTAEPYQVIANNVVGEKIVSGVLAHDLMSYCAGVGGPPSLPDGNDWISPRNWNALYAEFELPTPGPVPSARDTAGGPAGRALARGIAGRAAASGRGRSRPPRAGATLDAKQLRVIGFEDQYGLYITSVGPRVGAALQGTPARCTGCSYRLIGRGPRGRVLARVAMIAAGGHMDPLSPFLSVEADIPAAGVTSVEIESPTGRIATRTRPARAPHVRVLAPRLRAIVGGLHKVTIRWAATNPEHLKRALLTAQIDYSVDGGARWREIYFGPDNGHTTLPSAAFPASRDARLRVRINDGFNEAVAVSPRFTALDPPPQVAILSPLTPPGAQFAARVDGDALVELTGRAFNASLSPLTGSSLRWYDAGSFLGTGNTLSAGALPPGVNRITLVARDGHGRAALANTVVIVEPVSLPFLEPNIPGRISPAAHAFTVSPSSSLMASLTVDGQTSQVGPGDTPRMTIPVTPGRRPLIVSMTVTVNGLAIPFAARVLR